MNCVYWIMNVWFMLLMCLYFGLVGFWLLMVNGKILLMMVVIFSCGGGWNVVGSIVSVWG